MYVDVYVYMHVVQCSEVVQDMVLGTPDAPCSGFMREMQVFVEEEGGGGSYMYHP
jgi:hypothetical protein